MPNYNKVILAGHLTRDPEFRTTQGGMTVTNFGIAVTSKWKGKEGDAREDVMFIDVAAFGKLAETLQGCVKKGSPLLIEGRLKLETWEKDGQKHRKHTVTLDSFQFLNGKRDDEEEPAQPKRSGGRTTKAEDEAPF